MHKYIYLNIENIHYLFYINYIYLNIENIHYLILMHKLYLLLFTQSMVNWTFYVYFWLKSVINTTLYCIWSKKRELSDKVRYYTSWRRITQLLSVKGESTHNLGKSRRTWRTQFTSVYLNLRTIRTSVDKRSRVGVGGRGHEGLTYEWYE